MLRFHHGLSGQPALNVYANGKLVIANISFTQTSVYVEVGSCKLKGYDVSSNALVFTEKLKLKDKKYTVVLSSVGPSIVVYKDEFCTPKNGSALVRTLDTAASSNANVFAPSALGMQSFTVSGETITVDVINAGVYTIFHDAPSSMSSVLYNKPDECVVDLCFQEYIGKWIVVSSLQQQSPAYYIFYQTSEGKFQVDGTVSTPFVWLVHETDYCEYSLNGSANRQTLAILTRDGMSKCRYKQLVSTAKKLGYNTDMLVKK